MIEIPISPLQFDPLSRDYYAHPDALATAQIAPLSRELDCYRPKIFKAPASSDELIPALGYVKCGLHIPVGSIIIGFYNPAIVSTLLPASYIVQISDMSLLDEEGTPETFWDEPVPNAFLGNVKPSYLTADALQTAGMISAGICFLPAPHPVVGRGLFEIEFWDTLGGTSGPQGSSQRIELCIAALVPIECA